MTYSLARPKRRRATADVNKLDPQDRSAHDWYRFVLSFPPHLVREYLDRFDVRDGQCVLDPFCGTGTTVVECKKLGVRSVGVEANPLAAFASQVKVDWRLDADELMAFGNRVADAATTQLRAQGFDDAILRLRLADAPAPDPAERSLRGLPQELFDLLLTDSISPVPLHKTLVLLECIHAEASTSAERHARLALARALVQGIGNLHFGPEVGIGPAKADADVVGLWLDRVGAMADDLRTLSPRRDCEATVYHADARQVSSVLPHGSVDAVITSPPYPNEKDYTRTTRLESVLLGFVNSKQELRDLKQGLVRSNTRGVYKGDEDDQWVVEHPEIQRIAEQIEARRLELGKTSGFERMYPRVTKLYFGGMARHLADLRMVLRPGARLAYVVGDQASYLRVMIRTGRLISEIAESLGYRCDSIDLFRTRLATATREQLREEVVVLTWPGNGCDTAGTGRE